MTHKSTLRLMLIGLVAAIGIGILTYSVRVAPERRSLERLVQECTKPNPFDQFDPPSSEPQGKDSPKLVCDPQVLQSLGGATGIQRELVDVQGRIDNIKEDAAGIALIVLLLFSLPYLWYFLLRRIKELRDVLAGRESA